MRVVLVLLLVLLVPTGCATSPGRASARLLPVSAQVPVPVGAQPAEVMRIVDGDTLVLRGQGTGPLPRAPTRVRLLLVDAPETAGPPECLAARASARLASLVPVGATVSVAGDRIPRDRYGRTLLRVWDAAGRDVGLELVRAGLATVLVVRPNARHAEAYRAVEQEAGQAGRGVWSACPESSERSWTDGS